MANMRAHTPWWAGVLALAGLAMAQAPAAVTLVPSYKPGQKLVYSASIQSQIGADATMNTVAEIEMDILPGATPGHFDTAMHFTKYATTAQATNPANQASLAQEAASEDHAALSMTPTRFRVAPGMITVLARANGPSYDQAVEMLEELARTDSLPEGPVSVGNHWTRERSRAIPTLNFSVALTLPCALTSFGNLDGQPTAMVTIHSDGSTPLPPGSLPGSQQLAAQGLVPEATIRFDNDTTSQYRIADAVLLESQSQSHNHMEIRFIGPSPNARTTETDIASSATLKLEKSSQ
jgi:hypothetical protein